MKNVILYGAAGHAKVVADILERQEGYRIAGFIDPYRNKIGEQFFGYEILGDGQNTEELYLRHGIEYIMIALGDNWLRKSAHQKIVSTCPGIMFPTAVHPSAVIGKDVVIGAGSVVMPGAVINSGAELGMFCIVNTNASIDHDCDVGDFSSVAPNACLGGNVKLGKYSAVLIGANVRHGISIGEHTVIGAGATVLTDLPDQVLCYGTPAGIARNREIGEPYL